MPFKTNAFHSGLRVINKATNGQSGTNVRFFSLTSSKTFFTNAVPIPCPSNPFGTSVWVR